MLSPELFFEILVKEDVNFFSGVPDSLLKNVCAYISDNTTDKNHIIAANEGNALSLGIGYHLATNKLPLIYMQNSGLGNIINPLLSLADPEVYSIPMLLLIGWRGEPNTKDEPQHKKQGRVTIDLLNSMEIPYQIITPETTNLEINKIIQEASMYAKINNRPYALVVRKGSFQDYKLKKDNSKGGYPLLREQAIKLIVNKLNKEDIVVSTTGVTSRELFEYREELGQSHEKDFLTVGGMGHANQIALGIALQKPDRNIFCFDGDGAILMHMGSLAINGSTKCKNFKHIVFNNGAHDSVGGQPTVGYKIDITAIAKASGYSKVLQANNEDEIKNSLEDIYKHDGMSLLEVRVNKGFRKDLIRPTTTPLNNKRALMKFINK
jgi:phosphonopyruvate decarboxylase